MELVWTRDGKHRTDTVHRAGCQHIRISQARSNEGGPLTATSADEAVREIAHTMGWDDFPADADGVGFAIHVAPCVQ